MSAVPLPLPAPVGRDRVALMVGTQRVVCLISAEETGGAYSLLEITIPPHDPGPPPHVHTVEDETFYVLEGEQTVVVDGQEIHGRPGNWIVAPRNKPHRYRNDGDVPAKVLLIASPGGIEKFFQACGVPEPAEGPFVPTEADIQRILEEMPRFGMSLHVGL